LVDTKSKKFLLLPAVIFLLLVIWSKRVHHGWHDPENLWRDLTHKEIEEKIKNFGSPSPGALKEDPTLAEIEADPRYDQEWKTERIWEGEFHFSINHPQSWGVMVIPPFVRLHRPCGNICPTFYISVEPRGKNTNDLKQHRDFKVLLDPENNYEILEEEDTTIDGCKTYTIRVEHPAISGAKFPVRQRFYYVLTDNLIYKIEYWENDKGNNIYLPEEKWKYGDVFDRMVKSLRFWS
jgi:hypothetical protein